MVSGYIRDGEPWSQLKSISIGRQSREWKVYQGSDMEELLDWKLFPIVVETMTATEIRLMSSEFERSPEMERMRQCVERMTNQIIERIFLTPVQFRFPRSKKKRIRKKWRKDPENFRPLFPGGLEDIQITLKGGGSTTDVTVYQVRE